MTKQHVNSLENYENEPSKIVMGTTAGLTRVFNISAKLRLQDPLTISINGITTSKRVSKWVNEDPMLVWKLLYGKTPKGSTSLSLASDSLKALKNQVQKICPEALTELEARKKAHLSRRFKRLTK